MQPESKRSLKNLSVVHCYKKSTLPKVSLYCFHFLCGFILIFGFLGRWVHQRYNKGRCNSRKFRNPVLKKSSYSKASLLFMNNLLQIQPDNSFLDSFRYRSYWLCSVKWLGGNLLGYHSFLFYTLAWNGYPLDLWNSCRPIYEWGNQWRIGAL